VQYVLNKSYREYINIDNSKLLALDEFQSFVRRTGFDKNERFLLHYGSFTERKGTLKILRAAVQSQTIRLVLIGNFAESIRDEAKSLIELSCGRVEYFKYDENLLNSALSSCSGIIALYSNNNQSSALVEMAISLGLPVAVYNDGFLAYRIRGYSLGVVINKEGKIELPLERMLLLNVQTSIREINNITSCLAQIGLC
jgi:glycosyltransferase involved in cell wall biosynthesis